MKAIILFAHGSTLCGAGENLKNLAVRLETVGAAPIVEVGFLNFADPTFDAAFERCVERGATSITIAPYFLVAGYFVKVALPPRIEPLLLRFPHVSVTVAEALKAHPMLAEAVLASAAAPRAEATWRNALKEAPRWCRDNEQCPLHATPACPHQLLTGQQTDTSAAPPEQVELAAPCALLVMVHGSPRPESNRDMYRVVDIVRASQAFAQVEVGFMECNEPDIPTAIATCVAGGAQSIVAVPYFLHTGTHVADDLPGFLEAACATYPDVQFALGDYIGSNELLGQVLVERVREATATST